VLPLAVLITTALLARGLGAGGIAVLDSWPAATRVGLCAMFLLTASAHFNSMRHDLARMVPPSVPHPLAMIYFTGVCEILGAIGLLLPLTRIYATIGLILLLIAVLPANIHAARARIPLRGKPATPLVARVLLQILFIALVYWAGIIHPES
jgi:uncharacterized membrane protein